MYIWIVLLPLLASIYTGLLNRSIANKKACTITTVSMLVSCGISIIAFFKVAILNESVHIIIANWLNSGYLKVNWAIYIDELSALMLIVVTSVSSAVHIYSSSYMKEDPAIARFMSYLSLFTFFMLMLILSDNFLQLFFGWEGVGLCSYLLIGFWYKKNTANLASIKAFITNRVGDFAFIIGILTIYNTFGTLEFAPIFEITQTILAKRNIIIFGINMPLVEFICFLLFFGCMGKSAQIGLHIWLPDAMEGPTPVSALIHAATMVTAGLFLVARCSFIFEYAIYVKSIILVIGAVTALFAALIAIAQSDIKKIIAYSTCSQLGYMFIAAGVGAYQGSIFHLYTHAFFKALLFLSAGSVIHVMHQQNVEKMGGLRKYMPVTYAFFWIGSLALMGIFPFAGFYSKDLILVSAYLSETPTGDFAFRLGVLAAFCTSIYSGKIIFKVFHGNCPAKINKNELREPEKLQLFSLIFLAIGSIVSGYLGYKILDMETPIHGFFKKSIFLREYDIGEHAPILIEYIPMITALGGIMVSYLIYSTSLSKRIAKSFGPMYNIVHNKFYFDEIYDCLFVKATDKLAKICKSMDKNIIDFLGPTLFSKFTLSSSEKTKYIHNGAINFYAFMILSSIVLVLTLLVYKFI